MLTNKCSSYGIGFNARSDFSVNGEFGRNVIMFRVDNNQLVQTDNRKTDISVLHEGTAKGLDETAVQAEAKYSINFTRSRKKNCLSLHYNGSYSFSYINGVQIYQFKAKYSEINSYHLCLATI